MTPEQQISETELVDMDAYELLQYLNDIADDIESCVRKFTAKELRAADNARAPVIRAIVAKLYLSLPEVV